MAKKKASAAEAMAAEIERRLVSNYPNTYKLLAWLRQEYHNCRDIVERALQSREDAARDAINDMVIHEQLVSHVRDKMAGEVFIDYRALHPVPEEDK